MKTIQYSLILIFLTLSISTFMSCEDEFSEEDFLKMQAELSASQHAFDLEKLLLEYKLMRKNDSASMVFQQQLATFTEELKEADEKESLEALRQAGLLTSYTVTLETEAGVPIEGATVSIGGNNGEAARTTITTDASGQVIFKDLVIGANPVNVTATGFVGVAYSVNFGSTAFGSDYITVGNKIYPIGRHETSSIFMVSSDPAKGSFATVSGVATIETDLTNLTPEIPQDLTITAVLLKGSDSDYRVTSSGAAISGMRFIGDGIGSAKVDNATGAWSMMLPASQDNDVTYDFTIPNITADQKIAISKRNGKKIAPEYATVPTLFGPGVSEYDEIPVVPGAKAVFSPAPTQGAGFTFNFTKIPGSLGTGSHTFKADEEEVIGNTLYRLTNRGFGLSSSPVIEVTGGGGSGAVISAALSGRITGMNITTKADNLGGGSGYKRDDKLVVSVVPQDNSGNITGSPISTIITVTNVDATTGKIKGIELPTIGDGISSNVFLGYNVSQYVTSVSGGSGSGAELSVASVSAFVSEISVTNGGSGYTSAPTIAFQMGDAIGGRPIGFVAPTLTAVAVAFEYSVASVGGTGYSVLPNMEYKFTSDPASTIGAPANQVTDYVLVVDGESFGFQLLVEEYMLAVGVPVRRNTGLLRYKTIVPSFTTPLAVITPVPSLTASAEIFIFDGEVLYLFIDETGRGYDKPFTVTIEPSVEGAPGSGAVIQLTDFSSYSSQLEVNWYGGFDIKSGGSGYLSNLNRTKPAPSGSISPTSQVVSFRGISEFSVRGGKKYINDIKYGSGKHTQDVGGDDFPIEIEIEEAKIN